jgi:hypothetical protein
MKPTQNLSDITWPASGAGGGPEEFDPYKDLGEK